MLRFAFVLMAALLALPLHAEDEADARKELSSTLSALEASGKRQKEIAEKTLSLQKELASLQQEMVLMGKDTNAQEENLSSHEEKLAILEQQKKEKLQALNARQEELSSMISAMVKLKQLPPEAVIAMPGKLDETLAAARALSIVTHAIEAEAQSLKLQLRELDALEEKIHAGRVTIASHKVILNEKQMALAAKMEERAALVEKLGGQEKEEKERIANLTARSQTLQELVDSLGKSEYGFRTRKQQETEESDDDSEAKPSGHGLRSFEKARGHIRIPAAGKIISRFGDTGRGQTFSKGLIIETREDADVVAPFDGEVVFAGTFRDYGHIVIIRHSGDYHTLLSGLDEIDCKPGQYLLEGEPIGSMGSEGGTKLYMELREDGKPVDPGEWVNG